MHFKNKVCGYLLVSAVVLLGLLTCNSCASKNTSRHETKPDAGVSPSQTGPPVLNLAWELAEAPDSKPEIPKQRVFLKLSGAQDQKVEIGSYTGCHTDTQSDPIPGAVLTLHCWWAGAGDDLAAYCTAQNKITVRHRTTGETQAPSKFKDLKVIDILPNAVIK